MEFLQDLGYIGLFFGSFLAATVVPFSSDVLLIATLATGANPVASLMVATTGNWLGGLTSYWAGHLGKWEWIEKWFGTNKEKLEKQRDTVAKYGSWLALFTWLPFIGDIFAIALGFYKVDFKKTAIFMLIGKFLRFLLWAVLFHFFKIWLMPDI
jgi:membrane protein YqaA with SNARE-associated domain